MMDYKEDAIISESDYDEVEKQDTKQYIKETVLSLPQNIGMLYCVYIIRR